MSLKYRITLIIFAIEAVMVILILGIILTSSYRTSVLKQESRDLAVIRPLQELGHIALINDEYIDLQSYISFVPKSDGALSIMISDINGIVVAGDNIRSLGKKMPTLNNEGDLYWVQLPIENESGELGRIAVQFSNAALRNATYNLLYLGIFIAFLGMTLSAVVGIMMGKLLTRRLDVLRNAAQHFADGDLSHRTHFDGQDEISELGNTFNIMATMLQDHISEIEESRERLRLAVTGTNDGIWDWEISKGKVYFSPEYLDILQLDYNDPDTASINCWKHRIHPDDYPFVLESLMEHLSGEQNYFAYEHRIRNGKDEYIWVLTRARAQMQDGEPVRISGSLSDITIRKRYEQKIHHQAMHDSLTGLPNRSLFEDRLQSALHAAHRHNRSAVILMMDLNGFKDINDSYGHLVGDQILKEVAKRLSSVIRSEDTVSRFGGDEFVFILPETNVNQAVNVIHKIIDCLTPKIMIAQNEFSVTSSIGGAAYPQDSDTRDLLMKFADSAMYAAKSKGKPYQFFNENKPSQHSADIIRFKKK